MNLNKAKVPKELRAIIEDCNWKENTMGWSNAKVYFIENLKTGHNLYLKILPCSVYNTIKDENDILRWLKDKLPVSEVNYYNKYRNKEYLLTSEVLGVEIFECDIEVGIKIFAKGLKTLHSINIFDCPFNQTLNNRLAKAEINLKNIKAVGCGKRYNLIIKEAERLYEKLIEMKPNNEDLVFTHGDYTMANVIVNNNEISGFIDVGDGGVADRHNDIALAIISIKYNSQPSDYDKNIKLFLEIYNYNEIDYSKIYYYTLLNEFFHLFSINSKFLALTYIS